MKKKLFGFALAFAFILTGAMCLTACGGDPPETNYTISVKLNAEDWFESYIDNENGGVNVTYDYFTSVAYNFGDYSGSQSFFDSGSINFSSDEVKENTTCTVTITCRDGYDTNSVTITEKDNKTFNTRVGTGDDKYKIFIDMTPNSNETYEFSLSKPSAKIVQMALDNDYLDVSTLTINEDAGIYNFLKNTQVLVINNGEDKIDDNEHYEYLAKEVQNENDEGKHLELNLTDKAIEVDMSKNKAYLYVRFDPAIARKLIYTNNFLNNIFRVKESSGYYNELTLSTYKEDQSSAKQIYFDSAKQAYRYEFSIVNLSENARIVMRDDFATLFEYGKYDVSINTYSFGELSTNSLVFTNVSETKRKNYAEEQFFEFELTDYTTYAEYFDLNDIQFTFCGNSVTSSYADGKYTIKLNANTSPYDVAPYNNKSFDLDVKASSVILKSSLVVNTLTVSKGIVDFSSFSGLLMDKVEGNNIVVTIAKQSANDDYNDLLVRIKEANDYESFTLTMKLNDNTEITKTFTSGTHYNVKGLEEHYINTVQNDPINDLNIIKGVGSRLIWKDSTFEEDELIGDEYFNSAAYKKANKYISYSCGSSGELMITFNLPNNAEAINAEVIISDIVYRDIDISISADSQIEGFSVLRTVDGQANVTVDQDNPNKYNFDTKGSKTGDFKLEYKTGTAPENHYYDYYYEIKLYSNDKLFYTGLHNESGETMMNDDSYRVTLSEELVDNWETTAGYYGFKLDRNYDNNDINEYSMQFREHFLTSLTSLGKCADDSGNFAHVYILVDKVEITLKCKLLQFEND